MSRVIPPPHIERDAKGRTRLKISAGRPDGFGKGARSRFFSATGARQDRDGRSVMATAARGFQPTAWDLPRPEPKPPVPVDLPAALKLAGQSPTFAKALLEIQRAGWAIIVASVKKEAGCRKGTNLIAVESGRRDAFVARLVRHVAYARALGAPLPLLDPEAEDFARVNSVFLMHCDAEARLVGAQVRDELLAKGATDIGGPGLRGSQITAYLRLLEGAMTREQAVRAIAASPDGFEGRTFTVSEGTRSSVHFARAFENVPYVTPPLRPSLFEAVRHFRSIGSLTPESVERTLGVLLSEESANDVFVTHAAAVVGRDLVRAELRLPHPDKRPANFSPRLVLTVDEASQHVRLRSFETFFGTGVPYHLDLGPKPQATVAIPNDATTHAVYVTYGAPIGPVKAITFEAPPTSPA